MTGLTRHMAFQERALAPTGESRPHDEQFASLVARQARFVFRVAYSVLRNVQDAEDAVQDTFLKLYRAGAWQRMEDEKAFLARTAWRIAVDRLPAMRIGMAPVDVAGPGMNPETAAIAEDRHALVHRMIDSLPEELRQPLALSAIEELNSREIARIMGIAEGTVRTRLLRARELLKVKLSNLLGGPHDR